MILPSGDMDFDNHIGAEPTYFALQPSNLSSPSSDEFINSGFVREPSLEHAQPKSWTGILYYCLHKPCLTKKRAALIGVVLFIVILVIIFTANVFGNYEDLKSEDDLIPPDPIYPPPPSWSALRTFKRGAVCADGAPCASIGKTMLDRNGSAVDAALASLICNGLINMQSMGFGGGFFMTIYEKRKNQAFVLNARDAAPLSAFARLYDGMDMDASRSGGLSITVPGELAGYWEAHKRFGRLPWSELFKPSIELCEKGYNLSKVQYDGLHYNQNHIYLDPTLRDLFVDPKTNEFRKIGSTIKPKKLCETMKVIAEKNANELYNGSLGQILIDDLKRRGSILTMDDLNNYRVSWQDPISVELSDGMKLFTNDLPGGGPLLAFILNVFNDFKLSSKDVSNDNETIKTYQKMIETFKYAYALRTDFGDLNLSELIKNITSKEFARSVSLRIRDNVTWNDPVHYGAKNSDDLREHGTAHISVIAPNGDAVSATSTINIYFGSGVVSERTGILMNSGMDDFAIPDRLNYFGLPANKNNYIGPGKRPLSSMSPAIIVDKNGDVNLVIGAAGGTKIVTSVAYVAARKLWLGNTIKEAIDAPRIHHQLYPMKLTYEYGVPRDIVNGLKSIGHNTERYRSRGSVVCALVKRNYTIFANADYRKGGDVYGLID